MQAKTLGQREKELQALLATPAGRAELEALACRYGASNGRPRPKGTSPPSSSGSFQPVSSLPSSASTARRPPAWRAPSRELRQAVTPQAPAQAVMPAVAANQGPGLATRWGTP